MDYAKLKKAELIRRLKAMEPAAQIDAQRLLHDLQVHQAELEAQNDELRKAQQALEESRNRYAELYDFAPIGYLAMDDRGTIAQINLTGAAMLGAERAKIQGKSFRSYLAGGYVRVFTEYLDNVFANAGRVRHTTIITRQDGSIVDVRMESVLAYYDGQVFCLSALIDISEQLQLEARLREQAQTLVELDRRKDDFLATLAHELRNPLAPIHNAVQLMRARPDPKTAEWGIDLITRQLEHLTRLIDDLLDVERLVHGKIHFEKKPLDLVALVSQTIENSGAAQTLQQRLRALLPEEPVMVHGDAIRLTQVIENLLSNAAYSTARHGTVTVSVTRERGEVLLKISDTGVGIQSDMLPHIFEPFVQDDPGHGGLGLGLALVQQLVQEHDGTVFAESAGRDMGCTFSVRLPLFGDTGLDANARATPPALTGNSRRRVLVVEDNRDIADSLTVVLSDMGHAVRTAYDGESAVAIAPEFEPDIAFVDLSLPGIDGFEVATRLRTTFNGRPLILVAFTGFGGDEVGKRVRDSGFDAHLLKPGSAEALAGLLARR